MTIHDSGSSADLTRVGTNQVLEINSCNSQSMYEFKVCDIVTGIEVAVYCNNRRERVLFTKSRVPYPMF